MTTATTLSQHLQAILETDVDAIMRDYTEASVLVTPKGQLAGLAAIRSFFAQFIASSPPELLKAITLTHQEITGEIAYIVWKAEPFIPFASDTFLIRDDTIVVQTFAMAG
jgi:ketosteroid isomerase-like protein